MSGPTSVPLGQRGADRQRRVGRGRAARPARRRSTSGRSPGAAWCSAARPCRRGREHDAAHGQVEVGRRRHDRGVVAAELEQQPAEPAGHPRRDGAAHAGRAGRAEQRDARVVDQRLADRRRRRGRPRRWPPARPTRRAASATSAWQASAVSRVFSDGFHTTASPHTRASAVFHDHTATGKLKALMTPTTPSGCHCSIIRWPGRSEAIVRPNSWRDRPTRQVADVDHLLDLAEALGADLAGLDRHQRAEVGLVLAQQFAQLAHELAADRGGHGAPGRERLLGGADDRGDLAGVCDRQPGQHAAGDGRAGDQVAVGGSRHAEPGQDRGRLGYSSEWAGSFVGLGSSRSSDLS